VKSVREREKDKKRKLLGAYRQLLFVLTAFPQLFILFVSCCPNLSAASSKAPLHHVVSLDRVSGASAISIFLTASTPLKSSPHPSAFLLTILHLASQHVGVIVTVPIAAPVTFQVPSGSATTAYSSIDRSSHLC
jgi:hypothetical protein